ncbi:MAG: PadR family transcriptional regulator [Bacteroidota bacterium]|jgi:PadR family transcriptional regulator PadR|nr:PadR family transcriptional regulator [Bacteroidota bacterium]MEC7876468.1 PadR family transcriptional regulator [Bacteroidota bacterium]MEC8175533.1 PadR family transcriptional regulator [Bacteroidota bacterium]MEC8367535.1 PadR family transcriptional regulator [Bacteroidota bacterium]MEC8602014.1 PadR family transcriptional regulator [Bacteroidota bacterium]
MSSENFKIQLRKGLLEFCILQVLSNNKLYTSEIIENLNNSKIIVVEGTVYPLLSRLKNKGYVDNEWIESKQGPPRKYFNLTNQGKKYLSELVSSYKEVNSSIEKLIKSSK